MEGIYKERQCVVALSSQIQYEIHPQLDLRLGFRWTHSISSSHSKVPVDAHWIEDGYYYVSYPYRARHIGHFAESVNQLLLKLRYPSLYPPITDLYLPRFSSHEFEWSSTYLNLLFLLFPSGFTPKLHIANTISIDKGACFRSAVVRLIGV